MFAYSVCLDLFSSPVSLFDIHRFDLELVASQPDVDDLIKIEGIMNRPSSVSFRMTNQVQIAFEQLISLGSDVSLLQPQVQTILRCIPLNIWPM